MSVFFPRAAMIIYDKLLGLNTEVYALLLWRLEVLYHDVGRACSFKDRVSRYLAQVTAWPIHGYPYAHMTASVWK